MDKASTKSSIQHIFVKFRGRMNKDSKENVVNMNGFITRITDQLSIIKGRLHTEVNKEPKVVQYS